jgi:aspartyl-tRNA(Asn)/glutamyl-tRNA(Gln) amidotransferase subunit A
LSVPCGFDEGGLPVGLQLIGNTLEEAKILNVAYAYEQATGWHKQLAPCAEAETRQQPSDN